MQVVYSITFSMSDLVLCDRLNGRLSLFNHRIQFIFQSINFTLTIYNLITTVREAAKTAAKQQHQQQQQQQQQTFKYTEDNSTSSMTGNMNIKYLFSNLVWKR